MLGKVLNETFGQVYIKNMTKSVERRTLVEESFSKNGVQHTIVTAYDGCKFVDESYSFQHGPFPIPYPASAGFFGGQLTSIRILMDEIEKGSQSHIMCDDDSFIRNLDKVDANFINTIAKNLPFDWDIIILGSLGYDGDISTKKEFAYAKCSEHYHAAGSHAVAIRNTVYRPLLSIKIHFEHWGDGCIGKLIENGANVYYLTPSLIFQDRNLMSDINKIKPTDYIISRDV